MARNPWDGGSKEVGATTTETEITSSATTTALHTPLSPAASHTGLHAYGHRDVSLLITDADHYENPQKPHVTRNVAHIAFAEALVAQQPKKWTKAMFKLYFFLLAAFLNSLINSYDASLIGTISSMKDYQA